MRRLKMINDILMLVLPVIAIYHLVKLFEEVYDEQSKD